MLSGRRRWRGGKRGGGRGVRGEFGGPSFLFLLGFACGGGGGGEGLYFPGLSYVLGGCCVERTPDGVCDGALVVVVARVTRGHVTALVYYLFCHVVSFALGTLAWKLSVFESFVDFSME